MARVLGPEGYGEHHALLGEGEGEEAGLGRELAVKQAEDAVLEQEQLVTDGGNSYFAGGGIRTDLLDICLTAYTRGGTRFQKGAVHGRSQSEP